MRIRVKALLSVATAMLAGTMAQYALAVTPAGTVITNVARTQFSVDGQSTSIVSNAVTNNVDEILGVALTPKSDSPILVPSQGLPGFGVPFILTNQGNGTEAFHVKAQVPGQADALPVAVDVDGNGTYNPAVDIDIPFDGLTPAIAPGGSITLLLRFATPPTQSSSVTVAARVASGEGPAGTVLPRSGDHGVDAIIGPQNPAVLTLPFTVSFSERTVEPATLTKTQSVRAPDGSTAAVSGAIISYRLALATIGGETLSEAEIADAIPAGTAYVPGSLQIDGVAASDAGDSDAAHFDGNTIHVALGDIDQPTTRVVIFQVTIL